MKRLIWRTLGGLGWLLCEMAFRADCWGPFAWAYRAGCAAYHAEVDLGERWGFLVENPLAASDPDQPRLIEA